MHFGNFKRLSSKIQILYIWVCVFLHNLKTLLVSLKNWISYLWFRCARKRLTRDWEHAKIDMTKTPRSVLNYCVIQRGLPLKQRLIYGALENHSGSQTYSSLLLQKRCMENNFKKYLNYYETICAMRCKRGKNELLNFYNQRIESTEQPMFL